MSSLTLTRGDTRTFDLVAGVDLSGKTVRWTAKYRRDDVMADAVFAKTSEVDGGIEVTNAVGGLATVTIVAADWDAYVGRSALVWDLEIADGDEPKTPLRGDIRVRQDVTRPDPP